MPEPDQISDGLRGPGAEIHRDRIDRNIGHAALVHHHDGLAPGTVLPQDRQVPFVVGEDAENAIDMAVRDGAEMVRFADGIGMTAFQHHSIAVHRDLGLQRLDERGVKEVLQIRHDETDLPMSRATAARLGS